MILMYKVHINDTKIYDHKVSRNNSIKNFIGKN